MNKVKKYPAYKDSGIEWIGEIPEHWEVRKLKYVFDYILTGTTPNIIYFEDNGLLNWFTPGDLNTEMLSNSERKLQKKTPIRRFKKESILIVGIGATSGKTSYSIEAGSTNQQITSFHSVKNNNRFYYFCLKNSSNIFKQTANYTTLPIINNQYFKNYNLPLPPLSEQKQITSFLDQKTGEIDKAIELKQKENELLKERRQVAINQAVTRGLHPTVAYKDSGIEWIGEIPEHWEVRKLKHLGDVFNSNVDKLTKKTEIPVRLCNYVDVYNNATISENLPFMHATATNYEIEKFRVYKGDVIITKDSEDWQDIGVPSFVNYEADDFICGYHLTILRSNSSILLGKYLYYSLLAKYIKDWFSICSNGVTRYGLGLGSIKQVLVKIPPLSEQKEIAEYLEELDEKTNRLLELNNRAIAKLKEYKQVLIDQAVRGQICLV